ncbi:MAG: efflux RND transporter permease subunit [Planctomycetota bacterium]
MSATLPLRPPESGGWIARLVRNGVTPNVLMAALLLGGIFMATQIKQEVFPEFDLDAVTVRVGYPGSSPEEIERGILLSIEEAVRGLEGIDEVTATASEGSGTVRAELLRGADQQRVFQDIQQAVNRIRTFPDEAEKPVVSLEARRREVLDLQIYGEAGEGVLREVAEQVRDRLLQQDGITQVDLAGVRKPEIHVEIRASRLRELGLTLDEVARRIRDNAVEVPGGSLETRGGEMLLRVRERRDWAREFADLPIISSSLGAVRTLGDIADVEDGFEEKDLSSTFNGLPAVGLEVFRVGDETPISISQTVHEAMDRIEADLPAGVHYAINRDRSEIYQQRLELLMRNGLMGLALVLVVLGLFLDLRLAFWVTLGIPTAFMGGLLVLPAFDVTINMISLFAFIIALGIVVDDAIVAGENIYEYRQSGMSGEDAAIQGARDVATPIGVSIFTNIVAFMPLLFMPGTLGKTWIVIPIVVTAVFVMSWVESLFILPSHLAHAAKGYANPALKAISWLQQGFARGFSWFVNRVYAPFLGAVVRVRYITIAVMLATLVAALAYARSGRLGFVLMPKVESDRAVATARLPFGSPGHAAVEVRDRLVAAAQRVVAENGGEKLASGVHAEVDEDKIEVTVYLTAPDVRPMSTRDYTAAWREATGTVLGVDTLRFEFDRGGPGGGAGVTVEISHRDIDVLDQASQSLAASLSEFAATRDVDDGYRPGKRQLDFVLKPEARTAGLTSAEIARQVRGAFQGAEALRQQRGRDEVRVLVRLPAEERAQEASVEAFVVQLPGGGEAPLREIAEVDPERAYTTIDRRDGRRTVTITADVTPPTETQRVLEDLKATTLPQLQKDFPGLAWSFQGRQAELKESLESLEGSYLIVILILFVTLAITFRSYIQPVIVMIAIPFGMVGAILGHVWMGYELSMISIMGVVALSGVVVNDSLVLVDFANRSRQPGQSARDVIVAAGVRRFRPILLTTLTTFGGLAPMIFETSRQARFMIPMAISLGFGILFATAITLVLVPSLYLAIEDLRRFGRRLARWGA